ncbi:MAG TPA: CRISPR-associated protein Cas5, partial [Candidatus Omnitrophica bacterium]|nr:CRISPR-associated protein Cas5 [Candidatus Omnitrophota bacterium]
MKVIICKLRLNSLYSIRVPYTWQSALSYPILPPSAIIGIFANALQRYKNDRFPLEYLKMVEENTEWVGCKLDSPAVVKSYTTSAITKWETKIGDKSTNALGRQFIFGRNLKIAGIFSNDNFILEISPALKKVGITCGDSESLCSIEEIITEEVQKHEFNTEEEIEIEFPIPFNFEEIEILEGTGNLYLMHQKCDKGNLKHFPLKTYFYPLRIEDGIL